MKNEILVVFAHRHRVSGTVESGKDNSDVRHTSTGAFPKTVSCYSNDKVSSCKQN